MGEEWIWRGEKQETIQQRYKKVKQGSPMIPTLCNLGARPLNCALAIALATLLSLCVFATL